MVCKFVAGQKIVCVNVSHLYAGAPVKLNQVYTVSEVFEYLGDVFVRLAENQGDTGWYHWRFKPVEKKTTDISIFHKILKEAEKTTPQEVQLGDRVVVAPPDWDKHVNRIIQLRKDRGP